MPLRSAQGANSPRAAPMAHTQIDRDVEAMLLKLKGICKDIGKKLEDWLEKMDDYFDLAHSTNENKAMMGCFKLEKSAKLWWQDHSCESTLDPANATWEYIRTQLIKNYQNCMYRIECLNKFLGYSQGKETLDVFY